MKICHISDTHQRDFIIDKCDICIHTGDALGWGTEKELLKFKQQIKDNRHLCNRFIFVPGNHDKLFDTNSTLATEILKEENVEVAITEILQLGNYTAITSPYVQLFNGWAFERDLTFRQRYYSLMDKADIVLSHSPPNSICKKFGCEALEEYIEKYNPKWVLCGHDHEGKGKYFHSNGVTTIYNSATIQTYFEI